MRTLIAPDKFAGTLTAAEAAQAIAAGWSRARPDDEVVTVPVADGGEGTLDVVAAATAAETVLVEVADAMGHATQAAWLRLPDGRALVEAAQAVGLSALAPDARDPLRATSYGVGQLLLAATEAGAQELLVTLGGSATVDGGAGMATALGHRLLRADGNGVKVGARHLPELERIVAGPGLGVPVTVLSDVDNVLLGPRGAAPVFGPQKGADEHGVEVLASALAHWADVVERDLPGGPWRDLAGAGAAGGVGFALVAFCGARILEGAPTVGELVGFEEALAGADVVVTGEGKLDAQTAHGKAPGHVARRGREVGARVLAVAGRVEQGAEQGFDAVVDLGPEGMQRAAELAAERAATLAASLA